MPDSATGSPMSPDSSRPTFTDYWKRSREQHATTNKNITFISSNFEPSPDQGKDNGQKDESSLTKAQARRQQVRKAQVQHRQRKANYTQKLEEDAAKLRDDIARVQQEIANLSKSNEAMRSQLQVHQSQRTGFQIPSATPLDMSFMNMVSPDYTVSLAMSDEMSSPAFQVTRGSQPGLSATVSPHPTNAYSSATKGSIADTKMTDVVTAENALTQDQTDMVVNFILALEHVCWNHTHTIYEEPLHHPYPGVSPDLDDPDWLNDDKHNGHALTATAIALQSAEPPILRSIDDLKKQLIQQRQQATCRLSVDEPSQHTNEPPTLSVLTANQQIAWPATQLTLASLGRLASLLDKPDVELAPVQAWFEIARLYGLAVATDSAILQQLRFEFGRVVKCVRFGAAVPRPVFEDILMKVMGYLPETVIPFPWETDEWGGEEGTEEQQGDATGKTRSFYTNDEIRQGEEG
ncbi:hypothetical protein F5Y18DRAFT_426502 [Xylariaceae sp. FL1019]|nr:hypothetical protein F5Y18DRAFT_426502 [Xylariaceae sp. FL1019]